MMDLKLNVVEEDNPFSYEELIDVTNDYYEAVEELTSAEQELFEVNRACENLVALQNIVAKHGWSVVLNDLVGNQVSAESLDASCEGAFDKIKQVANKVGSSLKKVLDTSLRMFKFYRTFFKQAAEWLMNNKQQSTASTEGFMDGKDNIYYSLWSIVELQKSNHFDSYVDYKGEHIDKLLDSKCVGFNLSKMDNVKLANLCKSAVNDLDKAISRKEWIILKQKEHQMTDKLRNFEKKNNVDDEGVAHSYPKSAINSDGSIDVEKLLNHADSKDVRQKLETLEAKWGKMNDTRVSYRGPRFITMLIHKSCRTLVKEVRRRGFRFKQGTQASKLTSLFN